MEVLNPFVLFSEVIAKKVLENINVCISKTYKTDFSAFL